MTIGENIRHYRREQGLTQAQLAQSLGVSVQAVSKWETDAGLPDTAMLIPLANALKISTDKLLLNSDRHREYRKRWEYALQHWGNDLAKQLEVCTEVLQEEPDNTDFLFRAAFIEEWIAKDAADDRSREFHLGRALHYTSKLLALDPGHEPGKEHLVAVYAALGREDEALAAAYRCKDSSRALLSCLKGEALQRHRQKRIDRHFENLLREIDYAGLPEVTEALIRAAIPDGNYQHYIQFFIVHRVEQLNREIDSGEDEKAMESLWALLDLAKEADKTHTDPRFTAPLFDLLTGYHSNRPMAPQEVEMLFFRSGLRIPARLQQREDYARLLAEARTLCPDKV